MKFVVVVSEVSGETIILELVEKIDKENGNKNQIYDFLMCNPPFYSNESEYQENEEGKQGKSVLGQDLIQLTHQI